MFGDHFYNKSVRNTVIAFGSLFNNIKVSRKNSAGVEIKQIQIPLSYGNKAKFIRRLREEYSLSSGVEVSMTLPRIGFELSSVEYDTARKTNTLNRHKAYNSLLTTGQVKTNYSSVPYNLNFGLYIMTETVDDGLQIIEQIAPYFTPEFTVSLNLVDDLHQKVDVPIILNSSSVESETEGAMSTSDIRSVMWTLEFTAKSYMYSPVKTSPVIKTGITVLYENTIDTTFSGLTGAQSRIDITPNPAGATYGSDYDYTITTRVHGMTGTEAIDTSGNTLA
jgi:hypothetical protein